MTARVVPCKARSAALSDLRLITTWPSSIPISISGENVLFNSPLGPFTWTSEPCTLTCTPLGSATGKRPMRDTTTSYLPHFTEDLAAHTQLSGTRAGHHAFRRRKYGNTNPKKHPGDLLLLCINAATGLAHALDAEIT